MSTKIYKAYRVPLARLDEAVRLMDKAIWDAVCKNLLPHLVRKSTDVSVNLNQATAADLKLRALHSRPERTPYDPCGLWVNVLDGFAYLRPYGPYSVTESLAWPDWFEEYGYWNNSDAPAWARDEVRFEDQGHLRYGDIDWERTGPGYKRWHERSQTWDRIYRDGGFLDMPVFNFAGANSTQTYLRLLDFLGIGGK